MKSCTIKRQKMVKIKSRHAHLIWKIDGTKLKEYIREKNEMEKRSKDNSFLFMT